MWKTTAFLPAGAYQQSWSASASLQTTGLISRQGKCSCNVGEEVERESDAKDDNRIDEQIVETKNRGMNVNDCPWLFEL